MILLVHGATVELVRVVFIVGRPANNQLKSTTRNNLLHIYSTPPDDGLQICPKHVEVD